MKILGFDIRRRTEVGPPTETRAATIENPTVPVSADNFLSFFGVNSANLPNVTIDSALTVPAVLAAVAFLSRTMASLPFHAYRDTKDGAVKLTGKTAITLHDAPNDLMGSFRFRQYFWQQVFTGGRGLAWIERNGSIIESLWPMDPRKVTIKRSGFNVVYRHDGKEYPAADVIDVPFMLKADQISHYGPIMLASKAIQLALAMNEYGSNFFAGGGVPPLALVGPLPAGKEAMNRALADVSRAIDDAKATGKPIVPIPGNYELKPVGFDPEKGQMTEARLFQIQEISRCWQIPPVFLQDLSTGSFANVEQQDLSLVKHLIGQWAKAFEDEVNLKIFGRGNTGRYARHNLDGLQRGDFRSRIEGIARAIQTAQLTPDEARALENRPKHPNPAASELLVQGATVVLGQQPVQPVAPSPDNDNHDKENEADAA
jgi:HK97 family phage portal protein